MSQWIRVGKIKEAHGLKGELYVLLFSKEAPWLGELQRFAMAVSDEGPFSIEEVETTKPYKDGLILKAKGIQDRTGAEAKKGALFYVPASFLVSRRGEAIYLREIHGFTVQTPELKILGEIRDFSSNGPQDLLVIENDGKTFEIPFVEAFLKGIDFEKKTVTMDLPEGLCDPQ